MPQHNAHFSLSDNILVQRVADEMILLDIPRGLYFELNETGSAIPDAIERGSRTLAEIIDDLAGRYEVERETLAADVSEMIDRFRSEGFIHSAEGDAEIRAPG